MSHLFKADTDVEKANQVADHLAREVAKVEAHVSKKATDQTKLLIAALNIAGENFEIKDRYFKFRKAVADKSENLLGALNAVE